MTDERAGTSHAMARMTGILSLTLVAMILVIAHVSRPSGADNDHDRPATERFTRKAPAVPHDTAGLLPITEPAPVPGYAWRGWSRFRQGHCAWLPSDLLAQLEPVSKPRSENLTCAISLAYGVQLRIKWGWPGSKVFWSPFSTRTHTALAGLPARVSKLGLTLPSACQVSIRTQALAGLSVLAWRPTDAGRPPNPRCNEAVTAASLVARRFITSAGGAPWRLTPQTPDPAAFAGASACDLIAKGAATFDVDTKGSTRELTDHHDICSYRDHGTKITMEIINRRERDQAGSVPRAAAAASERRFADVLPARVERTPDRCAVVVTIKPHRTLRATYESAKHTEPCVAAELLAAQAVTALLNDTSS
jgi:hypothetical protein